jgi:hypothetical protein
MLSHHPRHREHYSDAAAMRREQERILGLVAQGIERSGLSVELQQRLILSLGAAGVGLPAGEEP